jgi:hypothetical protein
MVWGAKNDAPLLIRTLPALRIPSIQARVGVRRAQGPGAGVLWTDTLLVLEVEYGVEVG